MQKKMETTHIHIKEWTDRFKKEPSGEHAEILYKAFLFAFFLATDKGHDPTTALLETNKIWNDMVEETGIEKIIKAYRHFFLKYFLRSNPEVAGVVIAQIMEKTGGQVHVSNKK